MHKYGSTSLANLATGSLELQWIAHRAMEIANARYCYVVDFGIGEVFRTQEEQFERYKVGRTFINGKWKVTGKKITNCDGTDKVSFHQKKDALDFFAYVSGKANYSVDNLTAIASCFMEAASEANMEFEWGGNYQSFFDGCHFNLVRN